MPGVCKHGKTCEARCYACEDEAAAENRGFDKGRAKAVANHTQPPAEEDFFTPDKYHLDVELERQPRLYRQEAVKLAAADRDLAQAEAEVDLVKAEVKEAVDYARAKAARDVRRDPDGHGLAKVTDETVKEAVATNADVRQAVLEAARKIFKAESRRTRLAHDRDVLKANVIATVHRKGSVEKLCDLYLNEYYARPRVRDAAAAPLRRQASDRAFAPKKGRTEGA